jgi:hypothetical protein
MMHVLVHAHDMDDVLLDRKHLSTAIVIDSFESSNLSSFVTVVIDLTPFLEPCMVLIS